MWNLTSTFGELDISFKSSRTDGYEGLVRTALRVDVRAEQMPVASLADIIRSKEAAARGRAGHDPHPLAFVAPLI